MYRSDGSLYSPASDLCMDVWQSGTADGTTIDSYRCNGTPAQSWTIAFLSATKVQLVNPSSGKCLDSRAGTIGAAVQLYTCTNSTASQLFQLPDSAVAALTATVPGSLPLWTSSVPSTVFTVQALIKQDTGVCLDMDFNSGILGAGWPMSVRCNSTKATQIWSYRLDGSLYNPANDLCLDLMPTQKGRPLTVETNSFHRRATDRQRSRGPLACCLLRGQWHSLSILLTNNAWTRASLHCTLRPIVTAVTACIAFYRCSLTWVLAPQAC